MHEINQKMAEKKAITSEEHLESILYKFITLYGQLEIGRKKAKQQRLATARLIKEFSSEIGRFSKLEEYVIAKFKQGLEQTTANVSTMVHDAVSQSVEHAIGHSAMNIKHSAKDAERLFSKYQSALNWSHLKIVAIMGIISILACLTVVWWVMPKPTLPFTDAQIATYQNGIVFNSFWEKLSTRQKNWLLNVAKGKTNNREKLFEDMKKQYSDLSNAEVNEIVGE